MKIRFLLIGTSLSLIPSLTSAQCVATQDCATLGYTETSCSGGSGVKCPFGNFWACFKSESALCTDLGFTLSCTGTNQTGGGSKACNGKYSECTCAAGYVWNNSSQTCETTTTNCSIGALYYSDDTCSHNYIPDKTVLGIVIYEKSAGESGWVMTHKPIKTGIAWSTEDIDILELSNYESKSSLTDIQASCTNTDKITAQGNSSKYPAAWAAKNYKEGGKTWCLPSAGLLQRALDDSINFNKFNAAVEEIKASLGNNAAKILGIETGPSGYERIWSSSEYDNEYAWILHIEPFGSFSMDLFKKGYYYSSRYVRPVMPF